MAIDPDLIARYRAIVMQLPPLIRGVFVLHCVNEVEFKEIALRLAVPIQVVERALAQALIQIDRELGRSERGTRYSSHVDGSALTPKGAEGP